MRLGICAQVLHHLPFEQALRTAADLGVQAIELPVDASSPFIHLEEALEGGWRRIATQVRAAGLTISAVSNHQEGQLLLGPHHADTDRIFAGPPEEKSRFAARRLELTAALAQRLEVPVVCGFVGCDDYSRWFPWPAADGYDRMAPLFRDRMLPLLDTFSKYGVAFAHECHPKQFAYNLETAAWALRLVDEHPAFGFNFDPANLLLAGMDPVVFVVELGARIRHVHGKDGERVRHAVDRSGMLAHGAWDRPGRGFRFRVPGWGDLDWRRILTELHLARYDGVVAIEHEDPTMGRLEGIRQAIRHLEPLLLHDPIEERWW
jgi:sugar phosphate isomerase/epimerase